MIASSENGLEPESDLHIGFLNGNTTTSNTAITNDLLAQTNTPLKSFNIVSNADQKAAQTSNSTNKTIDYVFEKNDNTIKNLSHYLEKNQVNLLLINRDNNTESKSEKSEIKDVINKVNISLFITSNTQRQAI